MFTIVGKIANTSDIFEPLEGVEPPASWRFSGLSFVDIDINVPTSWNLEEVTESKVKFLFS